MFTVKHSRRYISSVILKFRLLCFTVCVVAISHHVVAADKGTVFKAGHSSLQTWKLPSTAPYPSDNEPTPERVRLGKMLFFDPRLSRDGNISCATCHNPTLGWSDGLPIGVGTGGKVLQRATPSIANTAFQPRQFWDGRVSTLETQALSPLRNKDEMHSHLEKVYSWLGDVPGYRAAFASAYPELPIGADSVARAIASFERTIIVRNTAFDRWLAGEEKAMSASQSNGFKVFVDRNKGNCAVCHKPPNFTDDGFHNVGLISYGKEAPDLGRYSVTPLAILKGAFKTPSLRNVARTAPYFHDGSAATIEDVIDHYIKGGEVKDNLSPNMKTLDLSEKEKRDLIAFMYALSSDEPDFAVPKLPLTRNHSGSFPAVRNSNNKPRTIIDAQLHD